MKPKPLPTFDEPLDSSFARLSKATIVGRLNSEIALRKEAEDRNRALSATNDQLAQENENVRSAYAKIILQINDRGQVNYGVVLKLHLLRLFCETPGLYAIRANALARFLNS